VSLVRAKRWRERQGLTRQIRQAATWTPAVNVPSANNVSNTSALASELICCFTSATNTRYIATRTGPVSGSEQLARVPFSSSSMRAPVLLVVPSLNAGGRRAIRHGFLVPYASQFKVTPYKTP
jgi:hypothetical protein